MNTPKVYNAIKIKDFDLEDDTLSFLQDQTVDFETTAISKREFADLILMAKEVEEDLALVSDLKRVGQFITQHNIQLIILS